MTFPHSPFQIRDVEVPNRLVMAPLHEITDQPFRKFIREVGGAVSYTHLTLPTNREV